MQLMSRARLATDKDSESLGTRLLLHRNAFSRELSWKKCTSLMRNKRSEKKGGSDNLCSSPRGVELSMRLTKSSLRKC